jgi:tetratricopeptide (TPR) repeat protein
VHGGISRGQARRKHLLERNMFKKFGFGFNKEKSRANAERYLQQNKLQNAVAEYEKILQAEPHDLTVVNQIGDIYARLGQNEKAVERFRQVGDTYINDGANVKAIAMYKKITKLDPNALPAMEKLAELYRKQGLVNDARSMLLQTADAFTKRGQSKETLRLLKQLVLFDPENVQVISRTADLMTQAGQKNEAKEMLSQTASTLVERHSLEPAKKILDRLIAIDAGNLRAQELRAQVTLELGDAGKAAELFEAIPDLDSRADALRNLLSAFLVLGKLDEACVVSRKMVGVHHDAEGVLRVACALYKENETLRAIGLYEEYCAELIAFDRESVLEQLQGAVSRVRTNPEALQSLYNLFQRAGEVSMIAEVLELLAHACVQADQLERARDVYQQLIELEPDSAAHRQEYRQVCIRLDPNAPELPPVKPESAPRSLEEFRAAHEPELPAQGYPPETQELIAAALSEAELYDSLSSKTQGIAILERALTSAPDDLRLNRTLGLLYRQSSNGSKAARCYFNMQRVLEGLGAKEAAEYYADLATAAPAADTPATNTWEAQGSEFTASEFTIEESVGGTEEIDLSDEWESVWTDESADKPHAASASTPARPDAAANIKELLEEAHFCLEQQIWGEAQSAIERLAKVFAQHPELPALRARLQQGMGGRPASDTPSATPSAGGAPQASPAEFYLGSSGNEFPLELSGGASSTQEASLGSLAADLDRALGDDFAPQQPARKSPAPPPAAAKAPVPRPPSAPPERVPYMAAAVEAEADLTPSVFGDLLQDFERDLAAPQDKDDDPETHFSLGLAFRDMGLLDEAIGELQKVTRLAGQGLSPERAYQACVWLATCFVEKSVPEASFKWFLRALETAPDEESHNAVNYELASAYEAAGRKKEALDRFLEVYGSNIDYRDVAGRIRDLRASL